MRVAGQNRRAELRRLRRERRRALPADAAAEEPRWREVRQLLDAELAALPERVRTPLILCYLQGHTHEEAARTLGWSLSTLRGRLERGRHALRRRLERLGLSAGAIPMPLVPGTVSAALRAAALATVQADLAGTALAPAVAAFLHGGTGLLRVLSGKLWLALGLVAVFVGAGLTYTLTAANAPKEPPARTPAAQPAPDQQPTRVDLAGDPLPADALVRMGTVRHRAVEGKIEHFPDGKNLLIRTYVYPEPVAGPSPPSHLIWMDQMSGKILDSWLAPDGRVFCGASADGHLAVTVREEVAQLWDVRTKKILCELEGKVGQKLIVTFSRDKRIILGRLAPRGIINASRLLSWDAATGRQLWPSPTGGQAWSVLGFSHDDKAIATLRTTFVKPGRYVYVIKLLERASGRELQEISTPDRTSRSWMLSPDGRVLVGGFDQAVPLFWDLTTGKQLPPVAGLAGPLAHAVFSQDGRTLLTQASNEAALHLWEWPNGKLRRRIALEAETSPAWLALTQDGQHVLFRRESEDAIRLRSLETGQELAPIQEGHQGTVHEAAVTADGKVISVGSDHMLRVWELRTGRQLLAVETQKQPTPAVLAISPELGLAATVDHLQGLIAIRELRTGRPLQTLQLSFRCAVSRLIFLLDGRRLLILGRALTTSNPKENAERFYLALWDLESGKQLRQFEGNDTTPWGSVLLTPDGRKLIGTSGEQIRIWDVATGKVLHELGHGAGRELTLSPDGRTLAYGTNTETVLVEVATGHERRRLVTGRASFQNLRFSPDGRHLACAMLSNSPEPGAIHLWDGVTGDLVHTFRGHTANIRNLQFTPNGRALVSASGDTTLLAWDVAGVLARSGKPAPQVTAAEAAAAWKALAGTDAAAAYRGITTLAAAPQHAVPLLREHMQPAAALDSKRVEEYLKQMESPRFAEREQATRELERDADRLETRLQEYLAAQPPLDARMRAQAILATCHGSIRHPQRLQTLRGLEVLEHLGGTAAHALLKHLTSGAPDAELTREAAAILERRARRDAARSQP